MTTKAQKIRVGVFVVMTAALVAVVMIVFGGLRFWEQYATYRIEFTGSVIGLEKGAHVYLNGIRVGRVDGIRVAAHNLENVEVTVAVKNDSPIHTDTRAMLQLAGITGLKVIDLRGGTHAAPRIPSGGTIPQGETTLDRLEKQAKEIADQSTGLMKRANQIVENLVVLTDPAKFDGVTEIIAQSKLAATRLAQTSDTLDAMVTENRASLQRSLVAVEKAATSTSAILDTQVTTLVANAGGVVNQLKNFLAGNEGPIRSAVFDLRQASRNFKELSREVRQRPSRLLFSSPPSEREMP